MHKILVTLWHPVLPPCNYNSCSACSVRSFGLRVTFMIFDVPWVSCEQWPKPFWKTLILQAWLLNRDTILPLHAVSLKWMANVVLVHLLHHVYQAIFGLHLPLAIRIKVRVVRSQRRLVVQERHWKKKHGTRLKWQWLSSLHFSGADCNCWLLISDECWN